MFLQYLQYRNFAPISKAGLMDEIFCVFEQKVSVNTTYFFYITKMLLKAWRDFLFDISEKKWGISIIAQNRHQVLYVLGLDK